MTDLPKLKAKGKEINPAHHDCPDPNAPIKIHYYALQPNRELIRCEGLGKS